MKRSEYLESVRGQSTELRKRMDKTLYLDIQQEPKGKHSSIHEKLFFRQEIKRQLKENNRRQFRGDLIIEIDYFLTLANPPALQTLSKNYLDLLHKQMTRIDSQKSLLFNDDSQVKILISNYHLDEYDIKEPHIEITAYSLGYFIKDIELADRILNNKFTNSDHFKDSRFDDNFRQDYNHDSRDYIIDLKNLEEKKEFYIRTFGEQYYILQKHFYTRQIQEQFLKQNNLGTRELISIFQPYFPNNKKYIKEKTFQSIWNSTRNLIFFSLSFLDFGNAPIKKGEKNIFKNNLKEELQRFKEKYKVLFPLLQPISVIIFFVPPKRNIVDLDNLALYIVPIVNEILEPPSITQFIYDNKYLNELLKKEVKITQQFPPNSIASYQLIHLPRQENDPENGAIKFVIADGLYHISNIWRTVKDTISKWERDYY